jgi:ABC-type oligopeptide transport system ATPase subunit
MGMATTRDLYINSRHPHTMASFSAAPVHDPDARRRRIELAGDLPSPIEACGGLQRRLLTEAQARDGVTYSRWLGVAS